MTHGVAEQGWSQTPDPLSRALSVLSVAGPSLLFGVRLWVSVCLALYLAFWLELDSAFWAGTTAAIVCAPQLGASLRKGWFRLIGTLIGATMIVVLTAWFPQDRIGFLVLLALWGGVCAFAATVLRNFASYGAAIAGFTAAVIAADTLGATGGANTTVFMFAVSRATEISLGIVCAGVVLAGTDLGGAQRRLAASLAALSAEITSGFTGMLVRAGPEMPDTTSQRRELLRRVIALDPVLDQAIGESSELLYRSPTLLTAVHGLFGAISGWRGVAIHLRQLPDDMTWRGAQTLLRTFPPELRSVLAAGAPTRWLAAPMDLRRLSERAMQTLIALPARTPSLRLLADQTTGLLADILRALDGIALLVNAPGQPQPGRRSIWPTVPDWLPALVNAARAFVVIGAVELFWVVTAWPNGAFAIAITTVVVLLLSPRGDQAYAAALAFTAGVVGAIVCAAIIKFAVLPQLDSFPAFCVAIGLVLVPVGTVLAQSRQPAVLAAVTAMAYLFVPSLQPANQITYDTIQFYNTALAIFVGSAVAAVSFRLLPPLSPALRARRLHAFALRDLRESAIAGRLPDPDDWERRMLGRIAALPDQSGIVESVRLMATFAIGNEITRLRRISLLFGLEPELNAALAALAQGHSAMTRTWLARLDRRLASLPGAEPGANLALRARASILGISERLAAHAAYFDAGAPA